jgi:H+/Cl- antiporter ClcA
VTINTIQLYLQLDEIKDPVLGFILCYCVLGFVSIITPWLLEIGSDYRQKKKEEEERERERKERKQFKIIKFNG